MYHMIHHESSTPSAYVLALDVATCLTHLDDTLRPLLAQLEQMPNNKSAEQMVRFFVNPSVVECVRGLRQSANPPRDIVLYTDNYDAGLGETLALDAKRAPLTVPRSRGVVPLTYRLDKGEGRGYLVEQAGEKFKELSTLAWAIGRILKLPCAPSVYFARSGFKYLPLLHQDMPNVSSVVLLDARADYHKDRHMFSWATDENRYRYEKIPAHTVAHWTKDHAIRFLAFMVYKGVSAPTMPQCVLIGDLAGTQEPKPWHERLVSRLA